MKYELTLADQWGCLLPGDAIQSAGPAMTTPTTSGESDDQSRIR